MNKQTKFIVTRNPKTSEKLKSLGFELVADSKGTWTFINSPKKIDFADIRDVHFTDILTF